MAISEDPYVNWARKGYDADTDCVLDFPEGVPRFVPGKPAKMVSFPPEASHYPFSFPPEANDPSKPNAPNSDKQEYPTSWPADPSVNFLLPGTRDFIARDHEWGFVCKNTGQDDAEDEEDLADRISREMNKHQLGLEQVLGYLPDKSLDLLITAKSVFQTLGNETTTHLVIFILQHARRLFAITLLSVQDTDLRTEAMRIFQNHGWTDSCAPVPDLMKKMDPTKPPGLLCRRLGAAKSRCTEECEGINAVDTHCNHDTLLTVFHHNVWKPRTFTQFYQNQWHFYISTLDSSVFIYDFAPNTILPLASYPP